MSGGWLGDPRSEPCEMGGGKIVYYGLAEPRSAAHRYVTKSAVNAKLDRITDMVEAGPLSRNAARALALRIRMMKERE